MSFDQEMNEVAKAESKPNYISVPCVALVTVKKYEMSPSDHKGRPYIEFTFETCDDAKSVNNSRLYRALPTDSEEVKGFMNTSIKSLLTNAGANWDLKGEEIIKSAIGNKVKALFKQEEYIGADKNANNMPVVRTSIKYSFSGLPDAELQGNQTYFHKRLKEADIKKLEGLMDKWKRDNPDSPQANPSTAQSVEDAPATDDDLPF
jgi:hypothetical protein